MNKIDCVENIEPRLDRDENGKIFRVWISAYTGAGIELLYQALAEQLSGMMTHTIYKN